MWGGRRRWLRGRGGSNGGAATEMWMEVAARLSDEDTRRPPVEMTMGVDAGLRSSGGSDNDLLLSFDGGLQRRAHSCDGDDGKMGGW
ncbi:hypothetical protein L484_012150 [Morus notabilis]|uniref:Uncharacterized protein n=1 Tax=Morus notabilis TaxID=981085 RepID=W9RHW7_9ROSA|nr:hypothetical protein L484_012150 [Morus notabilis]